MKFFGKEKKKKYQLITDTNWGNYVDVHEVVIEGSRREISAYAKKSKFKWTPQDKKPLGGYYVRSIDGYRKKIYNIIESPQ